MRVPALLRENVAFRRFWYSQTASLAGDQVSLVALPLVGVLVLDAGPGGMGLLTAAGWAPNLLLSLHAGAWVDRSGRPREAMIAADLGRAALLVTVPVAWALGALTFAHLVAVAFAAGALGAIASVAYGRSTARSWTGTASSRPGRSSTAAGPPRGSRGRAPAACSSRPSPLRSPCSPTRRRSSRPRGACAASASRRAESTATRAGCGTASASSRGRRSCGRSSPRPPR
jgi:hypothetical protein